LLKEPDFHFFCTKINIEFLAEIQGDHASHYFSQRSHLYSCSAVQRNNNLMTMQEHFLDFHHLLYIISSCTVLSKLFILFDICLVYNIRKGSDFLWRVKRLCVIFV
jgi:hypothetical protein